ncbi:CCL3 protein, partial [Alcedo cyanopectus]|nr:CCL3 protein [Ceyx cyanopectus]
SGARACALGWALTALSVCPSALADAVPSTCCFSYQQRMVPRSLLSAAYSTSSSCANPGVILVTKKKKLLCADPEMPWVRAHLQHFQKLAN